MQIENIQKKNTCKWLLDNTDFENCSLSLCISCIFLKYFENEWKQVGYGHESMHFMHLLKILWK